jgi:hypothetical protein
MKEKTIVRGQTAVRSESTATAALREQLETRARDYLRRCHDTAPSVERHTIWSRLYAASERLSIAVREGDVADAVIEIGSNLLGCEEIVIVQLHAETKLMSFLASVGVSATQRYALASKFNQIAAEIRRGQARIVDKRVAGDEFLASIGVSAPSYFSICCRRGSRSTRAIANCWDCFRSTWGRAFSGFRNVGKF